MPTSARRGYFVTFEGGEGSGKSTQVARLARFLRRGGYPVTVTREPGGTRLAEAVRGLVLEGRDLSPAAEALLFAAARADLVARVIRPALARGRVVICDRFVDSWYAYQGAGRGLDPRGLVAMNSAATGSLRPDLTFLLDLDPAVGLRRRRAARGSSNRFEGDAPAFHARVRRAYRALARADARRFVVLDAAASPESIETSVADVVRRRLKSRLGPARRRVL